MRLCYCAKKKIVSSANIIGTSTFEELGRSFRYNKNNNGASIERCDAPHLISFFIVSADSVNYSKLANDTVSYHLSNWQTKQDWRY